VDHVRLTGEDERSPWLSVSPRGSFFFSSNTDLVRVASFWSPTRCFGDAGLDLVALWHLLV